MTDFDMKKEAHLAKKASLIVAQLNRSQKDALLIAIADAILTSTDKIIAANRLDLDAGRRKGLSDAMLDRLTLNQQGIADIASAVREIASLDDPVGRIANLNLRPNGIQVGKMRIPLGVIAMIYEARPNVTAEAAALCLKSGNVVILRGGSEAIHSNLALADCIHQVLAEHSIPVNAVTVVKNTDRAVVETLLTLRESIDLVIPRGGESLIQYVTQHSQIPVIQHFKGVCHLYVDQYADFTKALNILMNGKIQRPSACNSLETLLVHEKVAAQFIPIAAAQLAEKSVKIHACAKSNPFFKEALLATEDDYHAEYLAQEIAVRIVDDLTHAIAHIHQYSSNHTEVIVSQDYSVTQQFIKAINSSVVMVNASSRFSDGGQLGLGAEIGISTSKLHAYGPMGLEALTTEKFVVFGDGQVRA